MLGFKKPDLGRWEKLGRDVTGHAGRVGESQEGIHVEADDPASRREPQLVLAVEDDPPDRVLFGQYRLVLPVRTPLTGQSDAAAGTRRAVVCAGSAVARPSALPEVPSAEGPDAFFAALSSTCRSVNSW